MAGMIAQFVGALLAAFLVSRVFRWVLRKRVQPGSLLVLSNVLTVIVTVTLGAYGGADGGPPQFLASAAIYVPAQFVIFGIDWWRSRRKPVAAVG